MYSKEQVRKNREALRFKVAGSLSNPLQQQKPLTQLANVSPYSKSRKRHMSDDITGFEFLKLTPQINYLTNFLDDFQLMQQIGEGTEARVFKCIQKKTSKLFAVKIIKSSQLQTQVRIKKQFSIVKKFAHPNIIQTHLLYFDHQNNRSFIVAQLYPYKTLQHFIKKKTVFSQKQVSFIICQILKGLKYLHKKGIAHRDVKPDNILYDPQTKKVILIDCQLVKQKDQDEQHLQMWTNTGQTFYKAPQMFDGGYNQLIDIWSLGVTAYVLVFGILPFYSQYEKDVLKKIVQEQPLFEIKQNMNFSKECINFIKKCLQKQPIKRYTATQAYESQFINKHQQKQELVDSPNYSSSQNSQESYRLNVHQIVRLHKVSVSTNQSRSLGEIPDLYQKEEELQILQQ